MRELKALLQGIVQDEPLDVAAAQIARIEYPELQIGPVVAQIDDIAAQIAIRAPRATGKTFLDAANAYLFGELGFAGNDLDYYDARNSCLNEVLNRRLGIPITLAVLYMEVARRLRQPVHGVGLPGHFIVAFDDGEYSTYIDPFHDGRFLDEDQCSDLVRERTGTSIDNPAVAFRRATKRQILSRMLQNLKGVYHKKMQWSKAIQVSNLLVEAYPNAPEEVRARAVAELQLRRFGAARADLRRYLELFPQAPDAKLIREQIGNLDKWSAQWN